MPILIGESATTSARECDVPTALDVLWHRGSKSPAPAVDSGTTFPAVWHISVWTRESRLALHSRTAARSALRRPPDIRLRRAQLRPGRLPHPAGAALHPPVLPRSSDPHGRRAGDARPHAA